MHQHLRALVELVRLSPLVLGVAFGIVQTYCQAAIRPFRRRDGQG